MAALVRRHAILRFAARIAPLPAQTIVQELSACAATGLPRGGPRAQPQSGQWAGIPYTALVAGTTVLTVWRDEGRAE